MGKVKISRLTVESPFTGFLNAITNSNLKKTEVSDNKLDKIQDNIQYPWNAYIPDFQTTSPRLGTPIADRYATLSTFGAINSLGVEIEGKTEVRLDTAIITVAKTRKIVQTIVNGLNGTINEYVGENSYQLSIKGSLLGQFSWQYDTDSSVALKILCNQRNAVTISSNYLIDTFGIESIAILNYTVNQNETFANKLDYTITAIADSDIGVFSTNLYDPTSAEGAIA